MCCYRFCKSIFYSRYYGSKTEGSGFNYYNGHFYDGINIFTPTSCEIKEDPHVFYNQNDNPHFIVDRSYNLERYDLNNNLISTEHINLFIKVETDIEGNLKTYKAESFDSEIWQHYDLNLVLIRSGQVEDAFVYTLTGNIFITDDFYLTVIVSFADFSDAEHFHIVSEV